MLGEFDVETVMRAFGFVYRYSGGMALVGKGMLRIEVSSSRVCASSADVGGRYRLFEEADDAARDFDLDPSFDSDCGRSERLGQVDSPAVTGEYCPCACGGRSSYCSESVVEGDGSTCGYTTPLPSDG